MSFMSGTKKYPSSADFNYNDRAPHQSHNAFERQDVVDEGTNSPNEALPPLLRLISTGNYSFIGSDSPDASVYAGMKFSDLESGNFMAGPGVENPQLVGYDASLQSEMIAPEAAILKLNVEDTEPTAYSQIRTAGSGISDSGAFQSSPLNYSDGAAFVLENSNLEKADLADDQKTAGILTPRSILANKSHSGSSPSLGADGVEMQKRVAFGNKPPKYDVNNTTQDEHVQNPVHDNTKKKITRKFFSQPLRPKPKHSGVMINKDSNHACSFPRCKSECSDSGTRKAQYVIFKTKSSKLEKQITRMRSKYQGEEKDHSEPTCREKSTKIVSVPAGRYFDALKGPELEVLKDSEELLLPHDQQWPFLLRFPIACFGITLGLGSQAMLWKTLATSSSMSFLHIPLVVNFVLWCLALAALISIVTIYSLKCLLYFEAVRREYYHPVRINFFFAPWIACMFLAIGVPPAVATSVYPAFWCIFIAPLFILELKIYGQWLSGGERRLSKVANPSTHLSLVGNFVGALLAAQVGWKEPACFFWAVGLAHYLVLFVTLYQRLPTAEVLPKELHPVFFLFVAAPSAASVAWKFMNGDFDKVSRLAYFVGLFLYASLVVRLDFFRGFQFSISWWAYTFPMTASAIASIHYSIEVEHPVTKGLSVLLSLVSATTVAFLFLSTLLHGLFWGTLFPNDIAIAITHKRVKRKNKALNSSLSNGFIENKGGNLGNGTDVKNSLIEEVKAFPASGQLGLVSVKSDPVVVKQIENDVMKSI